MTGASGGFNSRNDPHLCLSLNSVPMTVRFSYPDRSWSGGFCCWVCSNKLWFPVITSLSHLRSSGFTISYLLCSSRKNCWLFSLLNFFVRKEQCFPNSLHVEQETGHILLIFPYSFLYLLFLKSCVCVVNNYCYIIFHLLSFFISFSTFHWIYRIILLVNIIILFWIY